MDSNHSTPLPLAEGASPCVGSGMCCMRGSCDFGEPTSETDPSCRFLEQSSQEGGEQSRYTCGRYEYIITQPGWEISPAFGAGCCMPLFNERRRTILFESSK